MERKVVDRFECPICLTNYTYTLPKLLACIHTVCEHCLRDLIKNGKGRKFKCPLCREEIKVPKNGTEGFKTNIYLVPDETAAPKTRIACSFCAEDTSTTIRLQCGHSLCKSCSQTKATTSRPSSSEECPVCSETQSRVQPTGPITPPPRGVYSETRIPPRGTTAFGQRTEVYSAPCSEPQYLVLLPDVRQQGHERSQTPKRQAPPVPTSLGNLYPVEQLANLELQGRSQSDAPSLPKRPETTPVSPTAPHIEEIYDGGYDTMKGISDPLFGEEWYCGEISRDQSTEILQSIGEEDGHFLVRKTIKDDPSHVYTLDVLYGNDDYHLKIKRRPDDRYYVKNDAIEPRHFEDVRLLIKFLQEKPFLMEERRTGRPFKMSLRH